MDDPTTDLATLRDVEQRVLWLAARIVDAANRREGGEVKVGGHQASSASMVSIMTALWFGHLGGQDKVAVKPHASPVYHAIKYLTGELDRSYLTTLRQRGGLQAYPSRTKDPDVEDFSTGSVGLGAVAPLFSALTRRYIDSHFGDRPDALKRFFADAGWQVVEAKYGTRLTHAFAQPGGDALAAHIDAMDNEAYQSLFALSGDAIRTKFLAGADPAVLRFTAELDNDVLKRLVTDLGGHDLGMLLNAFDECSYDPERPSVLFAYTIKGYGLPMAGDPMNHAALMSPTEIDDLRSRVGLTEANEWDRFTPGSPAAELCALVGGDINNPERVDRPLLPVPQVSRPPIRSGSPSTQEAFGRVLASLADVDGVGQRIVTTAPDVSISTNLGGFINKRGVYSHEERDDHGGAERLLKWAPGPTGQHIELGISEMNLFMLLGQLGLSHDHHGEHLIPIGTVYDPFVLRGLDALIYGVYNDARFIVTGTPAGVTLAPEGGAHQSTITASVGAELPNITYVEPAYATEVDWLLCDAIDQLARPDGASTYLRLSTRPIDQAPFAAALDRLGESTLRSRVLAGGYRLLEAPDDGRPGVTIMTTGVMAPEALAAAAELDNEGVQASVIHLTSPDRLYTNWRAGYAETARTATVAQTTSHLRNLIPASERQLDRVGPRYPPVHAWRRPLWRIGNDRGSP